MYDHNHWIYHHSLMILVFVDILVQSTVWGIICYITFRAICKDWEEPLQPPLWAPLNFRGSMILYSTYPFNLPEVKKQRAPGSEARHPEEPSGDPQCFTFFSISSEKWEWFSVCGSPGIGAPSHVFCKGIPQKQVGLCQVSHSSSHSAGRLSEFSAGIRTLLSKR